MQIKSAVLAAAIIAFCDALATPVLSRSTYAVKETHFVPTEWTKADRAHGANTIQLQIGLKQGRFEELDRHLHEG
jgi:tripeptidyl-peptidase-1